MDKTFFSPIFSNTLEKIELLPSTKLQLLNSLQLCLKRSRAHCAFGLRAPLVGDPVYYELSNRHLVSHGSRTVEICWWHPWSRDQISSFSHQDSDVIWHLFIWYWYCHMVHLLWGYWQAHRVSQIGHFSFLGRAQVPCETSTSTTEGNGTHPITRFFLGVGCRCAKNSSWLFGLEKS